MSLNVVCWKWGDKYKAQHVNMLRAMLNRHCTVPHRLVCLTDNAGGIQKEVETIIMPRDFVMYPRQSRRLFFFSKEMEYLVGKRIAQIDLDTVICGNVDHIFGRDEEFVIWRSPSNGRHGYAYNPSLILMDAGCRSRVWDTFAANPERVMREADKAGWPTRADQSVISHMLAPNELEFRQEDGIVSFRDDMLDKSVLPENACMVSFYGKDDPLARNTRGQAPWIAHHWCM